MKKINVNDSEKLAAALEVVQKGVRARTIDYSDIMDAVEEVEARLESLLPKKCWKGIRVSCDMNAQNFPSAYSQKSWDNPKSTTFTLERGSAHWFVVDLRRRDCASVNGRYVLEMSDEQKMAVAEHVIQYKNW